MKEPATRAAKPEIVLDISRLLSRIRHLTPTGVDRVEMAYAVELLRMAPERLSFAAVHPTGFYGRIPDAVARRFLDGTRADWAGDGPAKPKGLARAVALGRILWQLRPRRVPRAFGPRVVIQSSPHHLDDQALVRRILSREQAGFVCLLHDLIPIEYPEYARPGGDTKHRSRIDTVAKLADVAIANSHATKQSFLRYRSVETREMTVEVAHLGMDIAHHLHVTPSDRPYFVSIGTIEPRKNHLLLLNLWRRMSEQGGPDAIPKLVLIGRRGWENEQIVDMLERCPALVGCVEERNGLQDAEMRDVVAGACALLMPSFAEGYGMPVTEALNLGVPVICSDLPALREAGNCVPDYLDPLDGPAWLKSIRDYERPDSAVREAQMQRIQAWRPTSWHEHVAIVLRQADGVAA